MSEKFSINNVLADCRYLTAPTHNVMKVTKYTFVASSTCELTLNITYQELDSHLKKHFHVSPKGEGELRKSAMTVVQQYRNHASTLNGFLSSVGKTMSSRVGIELAAGFDKAVLEYLAILTVGARSKRDRRSHLLRIRRIYEAVRKGTTDVTERTQTSLSIALRTAIANTGCGPELLARQVGVSASTLWRWLAGTMPSERCLPALRRLESKLGLERDSLVFKINASEDGTGAQATRTIEHRKTLVERAKEWPYRLKESELSEAFKSEWRSLFDYKTTSFPRIERTRRGTWRCIPADSDRLHSELTRRYDTVCPTASQVLEMLCAFLGVVLNVPRTRGGLLDAEDPARNLQTLAWLAEPDALATYVDWITARSSGILHRGQKTFSAVTAGLLRPKTGYLWQHPEYRLRLPESRRPQSDDAWRAMCELSHAQLRQVISASTGVSRSPSDPISDLLELENPLLPILNAIARIEADAAAASPGGRHQAVLKRDALLLSMLLANPLRRRTMKSMTWKPDGTGTLRGSPEQGWRIKLKAHHMKNGAKLEGGEYSVKVADWVKPRLDAYISEYRSTILDGRVSGYLFVSSTGARMWESISQRISELTKKYIPNSPGFGIHAFRHIVATDWLRQHPNDFLTVAELLNDSLETVLRDYAHLKRDTSFSRFERHIESML